MMPQQQLAFVLTDSSAKVLSSERQLIRRHCMRLKNKQPGSRRSKREAARATDRYYSPKAERQDQVLSRGEKRRQASNEHNALPPPSPSDWALFQFQEELDASSQKMMHQYFICNPIRDPLCPFKLFGIQIDFDQDPFWCFQMLVSEKLCFHALLLLASASNDLILRRSLSKTTYRHLQNTLPILNNRLSDTNAHQYDMILYVVGILASIAIVFGDHNAAQMHAAGISEILRLRGGVAAGTRNSMIHLSIDRKSLNFSSMLVTKLWTPIYNGSVWKDPVMPVGVTKLYYSRNMVCVDGLVDSNLAVVFHTLQHTAILLNKHYHNQTAVNGVFLQESLSFVHSSLIELDGQLTDVLSECIRLGMMALFAATFRLPGLYEHPCCKALANELHLSYAAARGSTSDVPETIDIWLMLVSLISVDNMDSLYVWESWKVLATRGLSWDGIRGHLQRVMWIDAFHDDLGRRAVDRFRKYLEISNVSDNCCLL
ncbi:hypothetical protein BGW36DRAFT_406490, partial [Talaromyces proteolyticus]